MNRFFTPRTLLVALVLLAGGLIGPLAARLVNGSPTVLASAPFMTRTAAPTVTLEPTAMVHSPTAAPLASTSPTTTPSPSRTPAPTETATAVPAPQGMTLIPAGHFLMGASGGAFGELPEHPALLDAFYLDTLEVPNASYQACIDAAACHQFRLAGSFARANYAANPNFAQYPVVGVTWDDATAYCQWAGKRLPTEAEWEYAASGPENLVWPWGNQFEAERLAAGVRDTQPVDSFADGASPFGIVNLAGNVAEWVADTYRAGFYGESPARNPLDLGDGYFRIHRGGSYGASDRSHYTTSRRQVQPRTYYDVQVGLRCARSAENPGQPAEASPGLIEEFCAAYRAYRPEAPCP